jgi:hypothetical protein
VRETIQKFNNGGKIAQKYVNMKIIGRLIIFGLIITTIFGLVAHKVYMGDLPLSLAVLGLFLGVVLGWILGRILKIFWNPTTQKVVARVDKTGIFFLILYFSVELGREWIFSHWLKGVELSTFVLIFLGGLLLGRLLILMKQIRDVLEKENKIESLYE